MAIQIVCAGVLAFLAVRIFGKKFIPWLEKHDFTQPVKDEVNQNIYTEKEESADGN